jgi:hypothetical protein
MLDVVALLPLISGALVCVCCAILLVRGVRWSFVVLFAASAVIQVLVRLSAVVVQPTTDSHFAVSRGMARAAGVISVLGILFFIAGWVLLTRFLLAHHSTPGKHGTPSV